MKNALITGASRGLGRALAEKLVERGVRVALVARGREALETTVAELRGRGGEAHAIVEDLGAPGAPHRIAGQAAAHLGPIDLLVNNASVLGPTPLRLLLDTDRHDFEEVLAANLVGPFQLAQIFGGAMAVRGEGTIVNISSDAAVEAYPGWGAYGVSKAGLDHLSAILGVELQERGVRVLSIDPGEMDTEMHRAAIPDADPEGLASPDAVAERILALIERECAGRWRAA